MDVFEALTLANQLIDQHLPGKGWTFHWSSSKTIFGVCWHRTRQIELSMPMTQVNDIVEVRDTLLHEIAHALVGDGHGHDRLWKMVARSIGARPERCYDAAKLTMPAGLWKATCPACGEAFYRARKPRTVKIHSRCARSARRMRIETDFLDLKWTRQEAPIEPTR